MHWGVRRFKEGGGRKGQTREETKMRSIYPAEKGPAISTVSKISSFSISRSPALFISSPFLSFFLALSFALSLSLSLRALWYISLYVYVSLIKSPFNRLNDNDELDGLDRRVLMKERSEPHSIPLCIFFQFLYFEFVLGCCEVSLPFLNSLFCLYPFYFLNSLSLCNEIMGCRAIGDAQLWKGNSGV